MRQRLRPSPITVERWQRRLSPQRASAPSILAAQASNTDKLENHQQASGGQDDEEYLVGGIDVRSRLHQARNHLRVSMLRSHHQCGGTTLEYNSSIMRRIRIGGCRQSAI